MKNTFTKIALLVLSLALLACVPFAVSAEETSNEVEILAKNVIYNDYIQLAFAVDVTLDEAESVTVVYKWGEDGDVKKAVLLDTTDPANVYKETNPVFAIEGVPAKELAATVYVAAYTGDALAEDAEWLSYSAAEYFYAKLYKDGFVNMTEADGEDYNRKCLYQTQLELGKYAQLVLNYNEDKLATDYSYIFTKNDNVSFGGKSTAFGYGELSLTATSELAISGWTLTDMNGEETTLETAILTAKGVYSVEPIFGGHECADENKDHKCENCGETLTECATNDGNHLCDLCGKVVSACADATADGKCDVCSKYLFTADVDSYGAGSGITAHNVGWNGTANKADSFSSVDTLSTANRPTNFGKGYWFNLVANPTDAADRVIQYNMNSTNSNWDSNGEFNSDSYLLFTPTEQVADGDLIVFQFDYWQNGGNTGKNPLLYYEAFANNATSTGNKVTYTWNADTNGDTTKETGVRPAQASSDIKNMTGWVPYQTWFTIRVVYSNTAHKSYYYVSTDGGVTFDYLKAVSYAQESDLTQVGFYAEYVWQCGATMYIDNVLCVKTNEATFGIDLP